MTIIHIVPGSGGGFYCQNCVRDIGLVRELHRAGHQVLFVPLYLPFSAAENPHAVKQAPVFYGALNVYLAQKLPGFNRLPESFRRRLDAPRLLRWAATRAGTTQAGGLGALTLSVLEGRHGRQRRELDQLVAWLGTQPRPDIIHISNALLLGLAPAIRAAFGVPVVCSLQDEDIWLDALPPDYRERCYTRIRELSRTVALFMPVSETYAAKARARFGLNETQCRTIPVGIDIDTFVPAHAPPATPVLGFLSELTADYGLDRLVEAFLILKRKPELAALRLAVTGGDTRAATPFLKHLRKRLESSGQADAVTFSDGYRQSSRPAFLQSLTALSVPATRPEAFGLFLIEAMACGIPVAQPRLGGYPEIIAATGGGVLVDDCSAAGLATALTPLLTDRALAARHGQAGRAGVIRHYSLRAMAQAMTQAYREAINQGNRITSGP